MGAAHHLGETAEALRLFERLRTSLATELGVDPSAETLQVHQAVLRDETVDAGTPPSGVAGAVPSDPTFVGRDDELRRLLDHW
jgi:DNA-binding SARP family transcriptional activator